MSVTAQTTSTTIPLHQRKDNFDLLRLLAASTVVVSHCYFLTGREASEPLYKASHLTDMGAFSVFIFFIISGYLIAGSWDSHKRAAAFLGKRLLRIMPALLVSVLMALFVLGPILTSKTQVEYFSNPYTWLYLNNISLYNRIHTLPGVFATNFTPGIINGTAWTLPYEFSMYLLLLLFGTLGWFNTHKRWILVLVFILGIIIQFNTHIWGTTFTSIEVFFINISVLIKNGTFFVAGMLYYVFKDKIIFDWKYCILAFVALIISFGQSDWFFPIMYLSLPYVILTVAYIPTSVGQLISKLGDFSYGIYIYGYPIQQILVSQMPHIKLLPMIAISLFLSVIAGALSWYTIEKTALTLKRYFKRDRYPDIPQIQRNVVVAD